jgi:SAM-dependent methyltransferase
MVNMNSEFIERHDEYYDTVRVSQNKGRISVPGEQYLVHLLRGGYLGDAWRHGQGRKALDVGCGSGYNAVTLAMLGWKVSATEITPEIVEHAAATVATYGQEIDFRVGENESLPFPDATFDLLLSMNVIHYCSSARAIQATAAEYARVLKPGALLVLATQHPDNWLLKNAEPQDGDMVVVRCSGDYRDGQRLFLFRDSDHLNAVFAPCFTNIRVGVNRTELFNRALTHQIMVAERREA